MVSIAFGVEKNEDGDTLTRGRRRKECRRKANGAYFNPDTLPHERKKKQQGS